MNKQFFPAIASVLVLVMGLALGKLFDLLTVWQAIVSVVIVTLLASVHLAVAAAYQSDRNSAEISLLISKFESLIKQTYPLWLYTSKSLTPFEAETPFKDVWIVSPDLSNDTFGPEHDIPIVVRKNAIRGVTYTYFIPKKHELIPAVRALRQLFEKLPQKLKIVEMAPVEWEQSFLAHVMVLNPHAVDGARPSVFMELPLDERGYGRSHWIRVGEDIAAKITGRLHYVLEAHEKSIA